MRTLQVTTSDGTRLHVFDSGGTGPAVLLLHGLAGYAGEWAQVAERLAGLDARAHVGTKTRTRADLVARLTRAIADDRAELSAALG